MQYTPGDDLEIAREEAAMFTAKRGAGHGVDTPQAQGWVFEEG